MYLVFLLCTHNGIIDLLIILLYFKIIRITVTPPSDFSVLESFSREMHFLSRTQNYLS